MQSKLVSGLFLFVCCLLSGIVLNAQIKTPSASSAATVKSSVGIGEVSVDYSRPSKKGRTIFGDLVPYGSIWRTGANATTKVTFSENATINGKEINKGTYGLYTVPGEKEWKIIFYKKLDLNGNLTASNFDEKEVAASVMVKPTTLSNTVETFSIDIQNINNFGASIDLAWDKTLVSIPFTYKTDEVVMKSIQARMAGPSAEDYLAAARYYSETDKDPKQALEWMRKGIDMAGERFWTLRQLSLLEAKSGDYKSAINTAKKSLQLATEAKNNDYIKMNNDSIKEWSSKVK